MSNEFESKDYLLYEPTRGTEAIIAQVKEQVQKYTQEHPEEKPEELKRMDLAVQKIEKGLWQIHDEIDATAPKPSFYYYAPEAFPFPLSLFPFKVSVGKVLSIKLADNIPAKLQIFVFRDGKSALQFFFLGKDNYARLKKTGIEMFEIDGKTMNVKETRYFPSSYDLKQVQDRMPFLIERGSSGEESDETEGITHLTGAAGAGPVDDGAGLLPFTGSDSSGAGSSSPKTSPRSDSTDTSV